MTAHMSLVLSLLLDIVPRALFLATSVARLSGLRALLHRSPTKAQLPPCPMVRHDLNARTC
jgi:hypothetical protein